MLLPATVGLTYVIAISLGHTELDWPYISDTGTGTCAVFLDCQES